MSDIIEWSGYKWLTRQRWGSVHDEADKRVDCWYDPDSVRVLNNDQLELSIHYNPKNFDINGQTITAHYGVGLITCETDFGYGKFEVECKMPKGKGLWPAFWMYNPTAGEMAKPEIDIFEGYSDKKGNYRECCSFLRPYNVESCLHLESGLGLPKTPAQKPWIWDFNSNPSDGFHKYSLNWTTELIEFKIDNKTVRYIDDQDIVNYCSNRKLILLLNTHIDGNFANTFEIDEKNPFLINYFSYDPL